MGSLAPSALVRRREYHGVGAAIVELRPIIRFNLARDLVPI
jgi:hypothetical protein